MTLTMRTLLVWGLLAGLLGGILAFTFAATVGEPPVEASIAIEEQAPGHDHEPAEPAPVSRGVQRTAGLAIATVAFGLALGGLFALAFAFGYGRIGRLTPQVTALVLAGIGFIAVQLAPFLVYPPNPPAVGQPNTIGDRTALYFTMMAISVAIAVAACYARRLIAGWRGVVAAATGYVVLVSAAGVLLPGFDEVPPGFPAQVLWEFRLASLGTQAVLWAAIGIGFAFLLDRAEHRATNRATADGLAAG
ncbi:MAG TPA: CbtA family protein [Micromonosporaceae bacterium]|nr:CbtA family protein [Micromonosporaceae bacterium]